MNNKLEDDNYCFACGEKNRHGLHLRFSFNNGTASAEFIPDKIHQGYKDIVHGGIISTLVDEAMVKAAIMQGISAVTAEITVRFRNPLMVGERAIVEAVITKINKRIIETSASLRKADDTLIAEGHAKLLRYD
jgi:uncharacterized protein (TIGR00369 family)